MTVAAQSHRSRLTSYRFLVRPITIRQFSTTWQGTEISVHALYTFIGRMEKRAGHDLTMYLLSTFLPILLFQRHHLLVLIKQEELIRLSRTDHVSITWNKEKAIDIPSLGLLHTQAKWLPCECGSQQLTQTSPASWNISMPYCEARRFTAPWRSRRSRWWGRWRVTAPCRWTWRWRSRGKFGWRTTPTCSCPSAGRRWRTCRLRSTGRTSTRRHDSAAQTEGWKGRHCLLQVKSMTITKERHWVSVYSFNHQITHRLFVPLV